MLTLPAALERARGQFARRPAIIDGACTWTWAEHMERVVRVAGVLQPLGLRRGERFGILSRNTPQQCELFHAAYWTGIVPVPINLRLAGPEMAFVLRDAGCSVVLVEPAVAALMDRPELAPWKERAVILDKEYESRVEGAAPAKRCEVTEDEDAILLYTGGTTGRGKGVRLTHRNIVANGLQVGLALGIRTDDIYLHVAPMFHSADLLSTAVTLAGGAHAYLPEFNPEAWLSAVQRTRATFTMLAPTMLILVLQRPDLASFDLSSLRIQVYGSAPMAEKWVRAALAALTGAQVVQGYGLTETAPILTFLSHADHQLALAGNEKILASAGKALPGVELRIEEGSGEILARGPNVTPGYLGLAEADAETFRGGWFHTGDVGRLDEDGFLYLLDRKKDVIVTGGENVYSSEVEAALFKHAGVAEAAVIGVPDELYGESVFAAVVARPGASLDGAELSAHCRKLIGGYKIPRKFAFVDSLPKSALGKVLKAELRKRYAS